MSDNERWWCIRSESFDEWTDSEREADAAREDLGTFNVVGPFVLESSIRGVVDENKQLRTALKLAQDAITSALEDIEALHDQIDSQNASAGPVAGR